MQRFEINDITANKSRILGVEIYATMLPFLDELCV